MNQNQILEVTQTPTNLKETASPEVSKTNLYLLIPFLAILCITVLCIAIYVSNVLGYPVNIYGAEIKNEYILYILLGFLAQSIDGAIGLAYGLITTTSLLAIGIPPALASACTHISEVFTTGTSGFSHLRLGNVNKKMFYSLVTPAIIGVILGAYILTSLDGNLIKPFVSVYLVVMGVIVVGKALYFKSIRKKKSKNLKVLGFTGGFMDAIGGGGWGAIVTSTLLSQKRSPKYAIGTVNFTEFFVTLASAGTFMGLLNLDIEHWVMIGCIVIGGVPASFLSAYLVNKINARALMFIVGCVIILMSSVTIYSAFFR